MRFRILLGFCLAALVAPGLQGQVVIGRDGRLPGVRRFHYTPIDGPALVRAARTGTQVQVQIAGQLHRLRLELNDMRAADHQVTIIGADGEREIAAPPTATYKGKLDDDPSSEVRFTITSRGVHGFVSLGKSWYFIEPTLQPDANLPIQHIEYAAADADTLPNSLSDVIMSGLGTPTAQGAVASPVVAGSPVTATVILDADAEFYNLDPSNWMTSQQALLNDVEGIFAADLNVRFRIRLQTVHTNPADLAGSAACSGSGQDLIVQLNNYWSGRHEGRDLVHLFSGKVFNAGIIGCTYEPSIGNNFYSAGLTQQVSSGNSSYTASALQKALVAAHEIGHAFNGDHSFATTTYNSACNCYDDTIMTAIFSGTTISPGGHHVVNHFSDANKSRMATQAQNVLCAIAAGSPLTGTASYLLEDKYQVAGQRQVVGCATGNARGWFSGNVQDFSGGSDGSGALLLGNSLGAAAWLHGNIWNYYSLNGGPGRAFADGSLLGYPTQDPAAGVPSSFSGSPVQQGVFQNGQILTYTGGARSGQSYALRGLLLTKWLASNIAVGLPIAEEASAATSSYGTAGRTQAFENGQIYWHTSGSRAGSSYYLHAAIATRYSSYGGSSSALGFPVSDEFASGGGTRNDFEGGYISAVSSTVTVVLTPETISKPAIPSGPPAGVTGASYTYTASGAVSSKGNPVRYRIIFGDGTDSGWLSTGVLAASKTWASGGTYSVTVQAATTDLSITSAISDPQTVTVSAPLAAPALLAPADSATGVSTSTALSWNAVGNSFGYSVYFGTVNPPPLALVGVGTTYSPTLSTATTYYWAVASRDPNNANAEARSPVRSFTTVSAAVSVTFTSSPAGASITVDGTTNSTPFVTSLSAGQHTISTPVSYSGAAGTQYVFSAWADGPIASSRTIAVGSGQPTSYSANYITQYQLTISASPPAGGSVSPASGSFYNAGTSVPVSASPTSGFVFANWSGSVAAASSASTSVTMNAPQTVTANFASLAGITFSSNPPGLPVTVDGNTQSAPFVLQLTPGSHTIATSTQTSGTTQNVFTSWSDGGGASHSITVSSGQAASFTANFTTQYQMTVSASPGQGGSVNPSGTLFYNAGSVVGLLASPASGYVFTGWSGAVASASNPSTTVTVNGPLSIVANFSALSGITFQTSPSGLPVTVDGNTQTAPFVLQLTPGTHTVATSTQTSGTTRNVFTSWSDGGGATHSVTINAGQPATFTANFTTQYQLTVAASPSQGGSVNPSGSSFYNAGSVVGLLASPASGYVFTGWSGGVASASNPSTTTTTVNGPLSVVANFSALSGISFQTNPTGFPITVDGNTQTAPFVLQLTPGTHTVATSTQSSGTTQNVFTSWSDGGAASHSITVNSGQAASFTANFTTQYQVTVAASPSQGGSVTPSGSSFYNAGSVVGLSASPASGYLFNGWSGGVASPSNPSTTVTVNGPLSITANFSALSGITFQTNPNGLPVTVDGVTQTAPFALQLTPGTHTVAAATQTSGTTRNVFTSWSDGGGATHSITVNSGQPATFTASFTTQYQMSVSASPSQGGAVNPSGSLFYNAGSVVGLLAVPASGYVFSSWSGATVSSAGASSTILITGPLNLMANFSSTATGVSSTVFMRQIYRDLLNREPDAAGLAYYVSALDTGAISRSQAAAQFFTSPEFSSAGLYLVKLYLAVLARNPDFGGWQFWFNQMNAGQPAESVLANFLTSPEFTTRFGSLGDSAFVTLVYRSVLGRDPDSGGLQYYTNALAGQQLSRASVFDQFVRSPEYATTSAPQAYGNLLYMGFLRRSADTSGLDFWRSGLAAGLPLSEAIKGFIDSAEYQARLAAAAP